MAKGHKTGGRVAGTPNKAGADVREAARSYSTSAIDTLAEIMRSSQSDAARVAAANSILDRACGKPTQTLANDPEHPFKAASPIDLSGLPEPMIRALAALRLPTE